MFGSKSKKRKRTLRKCHTCDSTKFSRNEETKEEICLSCGAVLVAAQLEVVEENLDMMTRARGGYVERRTTPKKSLRKTAPKKVVPTNYDVPEVEDGMITSNRISDPKLVEMPHPNILLQSLKVLLNANKKFLKENFHESIAKTTEKIWKEYCKNLKKRKTDVWVFYGKDLKSLRAQGYPAFPGPTPNLIIRIVALAINHSNAPLLTWDTCQLFKNGKLPFLQGVSLLPDVLFKDMNKHALVHFRYNIPRSAETLESFAIPLGKVLGKKWKWKPNDKSYLRNAELDRFYIICLRFASRTDLVPLEILWPYVLCVIHFAIIVEGEKNKGSSILYGSRPLEHEKVACFVMAAISFIPNWWERFMETMEKKISKPEDLLNEIKSTTSLVILGQDFPWSVSEILELVRPERTADFWEYLRYVDETLVKDVTSDHPSNLLGKHFDECKLKPKEDIKAMRVEQNSVRKERTKETVKKIKNVLKADPLDHSVVKNFVENYADTLGRWEHTYSELEKPERFLLDLFAALLHLTEKKKRDLHRSMVLGVTRYFPIMTEMPKAEAIHENIVQRAKPFLSYFEKNSKYV